MTIKAHEISVVAQGRRVPGWKSYSVTQDILQPANSFSMEVKFSREAWDLLDRDVEVQIFLDTTRILTGYIDRREKISSVSQGTLLRISGRDKTGRLVDESAPLLKYGGLNIKQLAELLVGDLFEDGVSLTEGTRNRSILRNVQARQARVVREPLLDPVAQSFRAATGLALPAVPTDAAAQLAGSRVVPRPPLVDPGIFQGRRVPKKVPPGASRWQILEEILTEARLMAWSSADGRKLIIGTPNYEQEIQFLFLEAGQRTGQSDKTNCAITVVQDVAEMYSAYIAVGASKGNSSNYGRNVVRNRSQVYDNPENRSDGTGVNFRRRKFLIISDDSIKDPQDALQRAELEKLQRESNFWECVVRTSGHSQLYAGEEPTIFAVDTMARVMDGDTGLGFEQGLPKDWLITQVTFTESAGAKTETELRMVPKGTLLSL